MKSKFIVGLISLFTLTAFASVDSEVPLAFESKSATEFLANELRKVVALDSGDADSSRDVARNCDHINPPGGWVSFPLECRRLEGFVEVALDENFRIVIARMSMAQNGIVVRNSSGELEYHLALQFGDFKLKSERVTWNEDRTYRIGDKIKGLCVEKSANGEPVVVCDAAFHGMLGRLVGGYRETYYGPGLNKARLVWSKSQEGHSPMFHWRAKVEVK